MQGVNAIQRSGDYDPIIKVGLWPRAHGPINGPGPLWAVTDISPGFHPAGFHAPFRAQFL